MKFQDHDEEQIATITICCPDLVHEETADVSWQTGNDDDQCVLILTRFLVPVVRRAAAFSSMLTELCVVDRSG